MCYQHEPRWIDMPSRPTRDLDAFVNHLGEPTEWFGSLVLDPKDAGTGSRARDPSGVRPGERRDSVIDIKPIKNESDYDAALAEIADLMDARVNTPQGDRLDVLVTLVEAYEEKHWRVNPPDPIEAIKLRMQQRGLSRRDLETVLGSKSGVSEVLNRKRAAHDRDDRRLHDRLGIPAEPLIQATTRSARQRRGRDRAA